MKIKKNFISKFYMLGTAALALSISACDDDGGGKIGNDTYGSFFISVMGDEDEYIIMAEDIETAESIDISENVAQLESSGYTWIFNTDPSAAIGLYYNQQNPGVGLGYGLDAEGKLRYLGSFQITSRYTTYGFFGNYVITSVGNVTLLDSDGTDLYDDNGNKRTDGATFNRLSLENLSLTDVTIPTLNLVNDDNMLVTFSGVVDLGNDIFMSGMVVSKAIDESATGGASTGDVPYYDSVWVAILDSDFNVTKIIRDGGRISYSSGRHRSQYYSQIGKSDDGRIYIFSGLFDYNNIEAVGMSPGALRINNTTDDTFDSGYHFDIGAKNGNYRFRKVWHIMDDYFLLECYNSPGRQTSVMDAATKYAVVKMDAQSFSWVSGIPSPDQITDTGLPMAYDGKIYFPIVTEGADPTIYVIDPVTATAKAGVSIRGAKSVNAVGRLTDK